MNCDVCGKEILRGQRYQGDKYKSLHFCSEECFKRYCKLKSKPKPLVNFKPEQGSDRRKFTDFIQEWTNDTANWPFLMKQAKDIQEEYDLDWNEMYLVCKYAKVYEGVEWDYQYGLGQIFPKYIKPCQDFRESIRQAKEQNVPEEQTVIIKKHKIVNKVKSFEEY